MKSLKDLFVFRKIFFAGLLGLSFIGSFLVNNSKVHAEELNFQGECSGSHHTWGSSPLTARFSPQNCILSVSRVSENYMLFVFYLPGEPYLPPIGFLTSPLNEGSFPMRALGWGESLVETEGGGCIQIETQDLRCTASTKRNSTIQLTFSSPQESTAP